jgi:hypothetical protein
MIPGVGAKVLYFPRVSPLSRGQAEQPLSDRLKLCLGGPRAESRSDFLTQQLPPPRPPLVGVARTPRRVIPGVVTNKTGSVMSPTSPGS